MAEAFTIGAWFDCTYLIRRILLTPNVPLVVRVAQVRVVQGAVRSLRQVDDVAVRAVHRAVGGLEVEGAADGAVGVQREPADPVLGVVGVEVGAAVGGREHACRGRRSRR